MNNMNNFIHDDIYKFQKCPHIYIYFQNSPGSPDHFSDASSEKANNTDEADPEIRTELGRLHYTVKELIAISIASKLAGGESDASFERHIQNLVIGLTSCDDLDEIKKGRVPSELKDLPGTRHKSAATLSKAGAVNITYRVYCNKCFRICGSGSEKPKIANCINPDCLEDLTEQLAEGNCFFVTLPIKDQLLEYLKDERFQKLLHNYKPMKWAQLQGTIHRGIIENGDFDLSLGIDSGQMHNKIGINVMPGVLFLNNLPVSWQLRYPILGALWTGKTKNEPERSVFLSVMLDELRGLEATPFNWYNKFTDRVVSSRVFLTMCISDAPEKATLLNQKGPGGYFCCPFCKIEGTSITAEDFEHVFTNNPYKRTFGGTVIAGGPRFPELIHKKRFPWRDDDERLEKGQQVIEERKRRNGDPDYADEGIMGIPAIHTLERFEETGSHVCDTLHNICLGVCSQILNNMVNGTPGSPHAFLSWGGNWKQYIKMQDSMTRVSESNRNPHHLDIYNSEWKAYDRYQFLIHQVALLCSDENLIQATKVYECLLHLSNVVFYCHYGRLTEEIIEKVENEIAVFSELYKKTFTEEYCTYKMHMLQHFTDMLRKHGPAYYTDGFNLERFISTCKKLTTTNKQHMKQLARNFLLRFHNSHFKDIEKFGPHAQLALKANGISDEFFWTFEDKILEEKREKKIKQHSPLFKYLEEFLPSLDFVRRSPMTISELIGSAVRVERMRRKTITLETKDAYHKKGSRVKDSLIQVDGDVFGQIHEILHFTEEEEIVIIINKFYKIFPRYTDKATIEYPDNQFPCREPSLPVYHGFVLKNDTFILKAQVGTTSYYESGFPVQIFTVRPNEFFRF